MYEARQNEVWAKPQETKFDDGSTKVTMGFKVLTVNDDLVQSDVVAQKLADFLNDERFGE